MATDSVSVKKMIVAGGPGISQANALVAFNAAIAVEEALVQVGTVMNIMQSGVRNYVDATPANACTIWAYINYQSKYIP